MTIHGYIKNRPLKIGFLVRDGELEDIKKTSFINTILWGGVYNPIIPINKQNNKFAISLLELYEVDCLYPINDSKEITDFVSSFSNLSMDNYYIDNLFNHEKDTNYLDLFDISMSLYKEEFKHKSDGFKSNFLNLSWQEDDNDNVLKSVIFGRLEYEGIDTYHDYNKLYNKYLCSDIKDISGKKELGKIYNKYIPILATGIYLDYGFGGKGDNYGVYFGNHKSFIDLVYFWNLRAQGKDVVFQPLKLDNYLGYTQKYLDDISEIINKSKFKTINLYYSSLSSTREDLETVLEKLTIGSEVCIHPLSMVSFNGMNLLTTRHYSEITKTSIGHFEQNPGFNTVTFPISNEKIFDNVSKSKKLIYSISAGLYGESNNSTLSLPIHNGLNKFYDRELFSHRFLQSSREGLDILDNLNASYITLKPVNYSSIVNEIFKLSGCEKVELSKSGIQTKKILEQMDYNTRDFFGSKVFKISTVRELVNSMTSEDSITRCDAIKEIIGRGKFKEFESLYIQKREDAKLNHHEVFDYLLTHDIFRPGLDIKCKECALKNWLSLKNIDEKWTCEYCGYQDLISTYLGGRNDWKFRLSGLFSKDNNQEGAIPVILTLLAFDDILQRNFIHGLSLNLDYGLSNKCETDIVIINQEERLGMIVNDKITIEIGIGEIKTKSNIEQNDIDNLKYVREKLIEQGFTPYLIFAKTADNFTEEEIEMFKKLKEEEIDIILFTNKELEKDGHIYTDLDVPNDFANNLFEVSENSKKIYLEN